MPITPIEIFSRGSTGLDQLFARGTAAIGEGIQRAVQLGRDQSNNQAQQERDFLTEQRREINLKQRRAENDRQDFEDDRRFERDALEFDTKFERGVKTEDREFDEGKRQFDVTDSFRRDQESRIAGDADEKIRQGDEQITQQERSLTIRESAEKRAKKSSVANIKRLKESIETSESQRETDELTRELNTAQAELRTTASAEFDKAMAAGNYGDATTILNTKLVNAGYDATELDTFRSQLPQFASKSKTEIKEDGETITEDEFNEMKIERDSLLTLKEEKIDLSETNELKLKKLNAQIKAIEKKRRGGLPSAEDGKDAAARAKAGIKSGGR